MPSSVIATVHYDPTHAVLTVTFVSGRVYRYFAVPAEIADGLAQAHSKGTYFNAFIRDRFPFQDIRAAAVTAGSTARTRRIGR